MEKKRKSGVLAHISSMPSKYGIGDFGRGVFDFIDFLADGNQKLWQILPLGPTSFGDSPYQCFSTFAGNHFFLSLDALVKEGLLSAKDVEICSGFSQEKVEYGEVISCKNKLFKKASINFFENLNGDKKKAFDKFVKDTKWLEDYSLFMALKYYFIEKRQNTFESKEWKEYSNINNKFLDKNQINDFFYGAVWNSWPKDIAQREPNAIEKYTQLLKNEIDMHKFLQFEFFRQWEIVKGYAKDKNIEIIGDIPIFVAMDSADVWANSKLFYLDKAGNPTEVAGVPPDYFSVTGQLWGNPLYKWEEHKKENYKWWISRVKEMLNLVDYIRIDHFRGFDEYWAVPYGEKTAQKGKWKKGPGKDLFNTINKELGNLPIIAEDLGIITESVEELRDELNLPGMKILQFAFVKDSQNLYLPHNFTNANCVIYTGTHDNDTTKGWYEKATEEERDYLRRYLNVSGENVSWDLIRLAWSSCAVFAITPLQDLLSQGSEARMNTPGVAVDNWQYRVQKEMLTKDIAMNLAYLSNIYER